MNRSSRGAPVVRSDGLLTEQVGEETVLLDTETSEMHCLAPLAAAVFAGCDGSRSIAELAEYAGSRLAEPVSAEHVETALAQLEERGLMAVSPKGLSRRGLIRRTAAATAALTAVPLVTSITPAFAQGSAAASCPRSLCASQQNGDVFCNTVESRRRTRASARTAAPLPRSGFHAPHRCRAPPGLEVVPIPRRISTASASSSAATPDPRLSDLPAASAPYERGFDAYGVRVSVAASEPGVLERLVELLPPELEPCPPESAQRRFVLFREEGVEGWLYHGGTGPSSAIPELTLAIGVLDADLRAFVAHNAKDHVFIHAGVVAHQGRAIVIPGQTFSGKSTLVAALISAGAVYYSDEFAVLDEHGLVHPYARPLSIRDPEDYRAERKTVASLGGTAGREPLQIGLIVVTRYGLQASWNPERRSAGQGVLALASHGMRVREQPERTLAAARTAAANAIVLEGERGEADLAARAVLEAADEAFGNGSVPPT